MSLLGRPWQLREVEDVEAFARTILEARLRRLGAHLREDILDDAIAYLLEVAVKADRSFDPSRGASFQSYLGWKLGNGVSTSTAASSAGRGSSSLTTRMKGRSPTSSHTTVDPAKVNWTARSPAGKASLKLATLISAGFSPAEVGSVYGMSTEAVKAAITDLRFEIRRQQEN